MTWLSEESQLLVENWRTVEDIFKAVDRLEEELSSLLHSVESGLVQEDWWSDDWVFIRRADDQVYISKEEWKAGNKYLVWIGVERFAAERVFGTASPPQFYVWVWRKHSDLAQALVGALKANEIDTLGEANHLQSGYIVRLALQKCAPGEIERFDDHTTQQIMDFFGHYANTLSRFDGIVERYIANLSQEASAAWSRSD